MSTKPTPTRPAQPARYEDVVKTAGQGGVTAAPPATTNAPAGVVRGKDQPTGSFAVDGREDDPGDRDLVARKPRIKDLIEQHLELDEPASYGDRFDWCRDPFGARYAFSRRYNATGILVDLFATDNRDVRDEVARKRAAIEAHNEAGAAAIKQLGETVKTDEAYEAGLTFMRQRGEAPLGYVPLIGMREIDLAALKAGAVLDLPPPAGADPFVPAGRGVGVR